MPNVRKKVLVVDDDEDILKLLKDTLEDHHFDCITAVNAVEGLQKVAEEKPNLILLDLMLPEMSGFGFMRELKNKAGLFRIPVVVLTALSDEEVAKVAMDLGAVAYLNKACEAKELISMVQEYTA